MATPDNFSTSRLDEQDGDSKLCDPSHESNIEYYCLTCRKGLCENCEVLFHFNCDAQELKSDGSLSLCEYIRNDTVQKISEFKAEVSRLHDDVEPKLETLIKNKEETLSKITDYYATIKEEFNAKLQREERDLKLKINSMLDGRENRISEVSNWCESMGDTLVAREKSLSELDIKQHEISDRGIGCLGTMLEAGDQIQRFKERISFMTVGEEVFRKVKFTVDETTQERLLNSPLGTVHELGTERVEPSVPVSVSPVPSAPVIVETAAPGRHDPDLPTYEEVAAIYPPQAYPPRSSPDRHFGHFRGIRNGDSRGIRNGDSRGIRNGNSRGIRNGDSRGFRNGDVWNNHSVARDSPEERPRIFGPQNEFDVGRCARGKVSITAMVWVGGRLLALDRWNGELRLFSDRGRLISVQKVPGHELWDVSSTLHNGSSMSYHCYVTSPKAKKIFHVSITDDSCDYRPDEISITSDFNTAKGYISITRLEITKQLVCGTGAPFEVPSVDIINYRGVLFRTIKSDTTGTHLFSYPRSVDATDDGHIIVCDWNKKEVLMMTSNGFVTARFKGGNRDYMFRSPVGTSICFDGTFVVSDCKRNAIYIVSLEGKLIGLIKLDDLQEPREINCKLENDGSAKLAVVMRDRFIKTFSMTLPPIRSTIEPTAPSDYIELTI